MHPVGLSEYPTENVGDRLSFDANLIENIIQPITRIMIYHDFAAPIWLQGLWALVNIFRVFIRV